MLVRTAEESSHVSVAGVGVDDSHSHCSWQTWLSIQIPPWRSSQQMPLCISTCPRKWASCGQDQSLRSFEQSNTENACGINERKFPNVPMPVMSCVTFYREYLQYMSNISTPPSSLLLAHLLHSKNVAEKCDEFGDGKKYETKPPPSSLLS